MKKKLTVIATFQSLPGRELELRSALMTLIAPTLKEEGCLNYDLHQSKEDPTKFLFYENWVSKEFLDHHLQSDHVQKLLSEREKFCEHAPSITFWEDVV